MVREWLDGDLQAQTFEASDEAMLDGVGVAVVEVIGAEVDVVALVLEHVVGNNEDRVADGDDRALPAAAGGEAAELGSEVAVCGPGRRPTGFGQGGAQGRAAL